MTLVFSKFSKLHVSLCNLCGQFWEKWLKVLVTLIHTCPQVQVITCANSNFFWSITFTFTWKSPLAQRNNISSDYIIIRFRVIPFGWSDQDLDLRSLGSWCVKGTSGSLSGWDFAVPLMHHIMIRVIRSGPRDRGSWILVRIDHAMASDAINPPIKKHWHLPFSSSLQVSLTSNFCFIARFCFFMMKTDTRRTCVTHPWKLQRISPFGTGANAAQMYFLLFRREAAETEPVGIIPCKQTSGGPVSVPL